MSAVAKIEVTVLPTEDCTLIGGEECATTFWTARHNETGEQVTITADDVAWVLDSPGVALSGARGYRRLWLIARIECVGLEMRLTPEDGAE